jgi:hypothetical protein
MEIYAAHYPPGSDFPISTLFLDVLGELVQTTAGEWITHPPTRCPNGHTLGPNQVLVGHVACLGHGGGGHTSWCCRSCDAVVYGPPLNKHCKCLVGPGTVRISTRCE